MTREPRILFVFGVYSNGRVDVSDGESDVLVRVTQDQADAAIEASQTAWNNWADEVERHCQSCWALPDESGHTHHGPGCTM